MREDASDIKKIQRAEGLEGRRDELRLLDKLPLMFADLAGGRDFPDRVLRLFMYMCE